MRTRFSRTYRQADGRLVTRVSPEPVNFSTDGGQSWQAVDNRVVAVSDPAYAAKNAASDYDVRLPRSLADPLKFTVGSRWVSFALGTDTPAPTLSGDTATYSVLPDLTASYSLHGAGVREALSLAAASAPVVFRYHVAASAGLSPRLSAGGVLFVDETGRVRFGFSPPTVLDANGAAGHAAFALDQAGTGWTLTLTVDAGWLHDAARSFPVVVDPDVYWVSGSLRFSGATVDCHLDQAAGSTSFCGTPWLYAGGTGGDQETLLARFDLHDAIPRSAQVYGATFGLRMTDRTGAADPSMLEGHRVTVPWTEGATWSTFDGTQAWPAGFIDPTPAGPGITLGDPGWYGWDVTKLAQQWVNGETPNDGLALQDPTGSPQTRYEFVSTDGEPAQAPYLDIAWIPAVGQIGHYTLLDIASTATSEVRVNPGNGNVIIDSTDAPLAGFDEGLARSYNTQGGWFQWSSFGPGWIPHYGAGVAFMEFPGGVDADFPDGAALPFFRNPDGSYSSSEPDYASLQANADGSYTVHIADPAPDGTSITATTYGWQPQQIVRGAASVAVSREDPDGVRTFTDGAGAVLTQHKDGSNRIDSVTEQATGRTVTYDYRADGMLEAVHTPERDTTYTYAGFRDVITSIAESSGTTIAFDYDGQGRVTRIARTEDGTTRETTVAYESPSAPCDPARDAGKTVVTDAYGTDTYCYDATLHVTAHDTTDAIVHEYAYDGDPATDGSELAEEYVRLRDRSARRVGEGGSYDTQTIVDCVANAAGCAESRSYDATENLFITLTSTATTDDRINVSEALDTVDGISGTPDDSGPIGDALQAWQTVPPGHGPTYKMFQTAEDATVDGEDLTITNRVWIDATTGLPLHREEREGDTVTDEEYFSYDPQSLTLEQLGSDFFTPAAPAGADQDSYTFDAPPARPFAARAAAPPQRSRTERFDDAKAFRQAHGFDTAADQINDLLDHPPTNASTTRFGVALTSSELARMQRQMALQKAASDLTGAIGADPDYAGSYLDPQHGLLYIGFTRAAARRVAALRARFAYPAALRAYSLRRSLGDLQALQDRIHNDAALLRTGAPITTIGLDEQANQVVVGVADPTRSVIATLRSRYGPAIRVKATDPRPAGLQHVATGNSFGVYWNQTWPSQGENCTLGFGGWRRDSTGRKYYYQLSAGHCIGPIDNPDDPSDDDFVNATPFSYWRGGYRAGYSRSVISHFIRIGRVQGNYYPKPNTSSNADSMAIYLFPQGRHSARLAFDVGSLPNKYERVVGPNGGALLHDTVCQYGTMTNDVECGEVVGTNVERTQDHGATLTGLTDVRMDAQCSVTGGDSGGPVFTTASRGIYAEGFIDLLEPDETNCGNGGGPFTTDTGEETYYTPLDNALRKFGLQLTHANP